MLRSTDKVVSRRQDARKHAWACDGGIDMASARFGVDGTGAAGVSRPTAHWHGNAMASQGFSCVEGVAPTDFVAEEALLQGQVRSAAGAALSQGR